MIPRQKCPGNLVLSILEYTGIYWNFISLLLYEPCYSVFARHSHINTNSDILTLCNDTCSQQSLETCVDPESQHRVIRKLKAKARDPQQLELERKEQGFSLYVNGAHSEHSKKRSPPSASRSAKTAGGRLLFYTL